MKENGNTLKKSTSKLKSSRKMEIINVSIFKESEIVAKAIQEKSEDDTDAYWWDPVADKEVKVKPLSQEQAQKLKDYILGIKATDCYDEEVSKIVEEETATFYSGQKTAEQVAEIIQNRVTTYLNENS